MLTRRIKNPALVSPIRLVTHCGHEKKRILFFADTGRNAHGRDCLSEPT